MKLGQILMVLRARFGLVFGVLCLVVAVVGTASVLLPKRYVAAVSLVVDTKATDPVTGALLPLQMLPGYLATQIDIIKSHSVALKVVDRLKLADLPAIVDQFREDTDGAGTIRDWLADRLLLQLDVRPSRESSVLDVTYTSVDPHIAADMANAFGEAYVQTNLELKVDPARRRAGWFEDQVADLRKALEAAQQKLSDYQSEHAIVASAPDRVDLENARLAELATQLVAAQSSMYGAATRQKQMGDAVLRDRVGELPELIGNQLVQGLKAELVRAEARLADVGSRYGFNHPLYVSAEAERNSLRLKLAAEVETARGGINQNAEIAGRQVTRLEEAVEQQKARVLELNEQRDILAVLTRDVDSARAAYDAAMDRKAHLRLESEINQTDIAVLNPAVPPLKPAYPLLALNLVLAAVLGTALGAGAALLAEASNRRVRARSDLAELCGVPVLAELGRATRRERRQAQTPAPVAVA
jgi:succinoglycan biosynthesis transport protein ExoP